MHYLLLNIFVNSSMLEKLMAVGRNKTDKQCHLADTFSWNSCQKLLHCEGACTNGSDCQFPFCNIQHKCECRKAWCTTGITCSFFQIGCNGTYSCVNSQCICRYD
ncbi:hypothetical protein ACJMK2_004140 [Sinanodonta woodiana]|uniref:Uncharacterized protein n=1 Tax=Sinanodonta woodiana TaxID=1069815 RepID=A0ABD3Y2X6_SINWO